MSLTDHLLTSRQPGLRERKKAQTRAAIQRHALRLFREQGYSATTMEQVAEAADISPSTLYRYFPTKEDLVLADDYDPLLAAAFRAAPAELSALEALRYSLRKVIQELPPEVMVEMRERTRLMMAAPEVRARVLDNFTTTMELFAQLFAERAGLPEDDSSVQLAAGSVIGVMLAAQFRWFKHPEEDMLEVLDQAIFSLINGPGVFGPSAEKRG